jgi:hypothetical protein
MTSHSLNTNEPDGKGNDVGGELTRVEELVREANYYSQEASRTGFRTYEELARFAVKAAYEQAIIDLHSPEPAPGKGEALGRTLEALKTLTIPLAGDSHFASGADRMSRPAAAVSGGLGGAGDGDRLKPLAEDIRAAELEQANAILETFEAKLRPDEILTAVHSPARHGEPPTYGVAIIEANGLVRTFRGSSLRDALGQASQWIGAR